MVKVRGKGEHRVEALRLADAFRARVIDAATESFVFEITGASDKIEQFIDADAAARPGRGLAHRHRGDRARAGGDVDAAATTFLALVVFAFVMAFTPGPNNIMLTASGVELRLRAYDAAHRWASTLGFVVLLVACRRPALALSARDFSGLADGAEDRRRGLHAVARLEGRECAQQPSDDERRARGR